jgi:phytoene dehydrogenase-like protein
LNGAYYPRGGGGAIPRAFIRALRRAGGEIRMRAEVERILVERGRAIGVRLADGTEIRSRVVISNADPAVTLGRLVGPDHLSAWQRRRLRRMKWSVTAISLFCATDLDLRALGIDSGNYWYFADGDVDRAYRRGLEAWRPEAGPLPSGIITSATLKDPSARRGGHHTIEGFAFVAYDLFEEWASSRPDARPERYQALKQMLLERMIEMAGRVVPGLERNLLLAEIGTPLTNVHFCAATRGSLYGTEKRLSQIGPFGQRFKTSIKDLWMCGASTLSHGVIWAHHSGLATAAAILGCTVADLCRHRGHPINILPAESAQPTDDAAFTPRVELIEEGGFQYANQER